MSGALHRVLVVKKWLLPHRVSDGICSNLAVLLRRQADPSTGRPPGEGSRRDHQVNDVPQLMLDDAVLPVLRGGDQLLCQPDVASPPVGVAVAMEGHPEAAWGTEMCVGSNIPRQGQLDPQDRFGFALATLCEVSESHRVTRRPERTRAPSIMSPPTR